MPASIKRTKGTTFPTYFYEWQKSSVERVSARSSFETGRNPWQRHQELPFNRGTCDLRTWHATKSERIRPNSGDDVTRWLVSRRPDEICESEAIRSFPFCSVFTLWTIARHTLSSTTRGSNRFHSLCFYGSTEETKPFRLATEALSLSICSIEAIRVRLPPQEDRKVFSMLNNDCTIFSLFQLFLFADLPFEARCFQGIFFLSFSKVRWECVRTFYSADYEIVVHSVWYHFYVALWEALTLLMVWGGFHRIHSTFISMHFDHHLESIEQINHRISGSAPLLWWF